MYLSIEFVLCPLKSEILFRFLMIYILEETMHFFLERHHQVQEDDSQETTTADTTLSSRHADQLMILSVERLDCKRPILWLASYKILTPTPLTALTPPPAAFGAAVRTHSLGGDGGGGGGQYFGRRPAQLCTLRR